MAENGLPKCEGDSPTGCCSEARERTQKYKRDFWGHRIGSADVLEASTAWLWILVKEL